MSFMLLFVAVLLLFSLSSVSAASFNSDHSSSDIQNFIDTGLGDDELVLEEGDYIDTLYNLNVSRKVNIKSNGKVNIKSSTGGILFNVTAKEVQILNLNISGYQTAIRSNIGGLSVIGNNITTNDISISISGSGDLSDISLENNTIISSVSNNNYGAVYVNANSGSTVGISAKNNNITANNPTNSHGVRFNVTYCDNSVFFDNNNITVNSGYGVYLYTGYWSNNNITLTNNNITGTSGAGVYLSASSSNNTITLTNNNITGTWAGVALSAYSSNNNITLTNNNITGNSGNGVSLYAYTSNNTILSFIGNNITGIDYAMYIYSYNQFSGLSFLNNTFKSDDIGLYFVLNGAVLSDILVKGNSIFALNTGIGFEEQNPSSVNLTVNYNRIIADVGLDFTTTDDSSNFDYNWWGINDISSKIFGFDTNNHYILNITNLTSLDNVRPRDKVNFALLVLNTTLTNEGVENLPYFVITGTFNGENYNTTTDDLFVHQFTVPGEGIHAIDALVDEQYVSLEFNASKGNTSSTIVVPDDAHTGKTVNITGIATDDKGTPLANIVITVTVDGVAYNVTTDSNGRWTLVYKPTHIGNINVSVFWAGNNVYNGFTNSSNFNVAKRNIIVTMVVKENKDGSVTIIANATYEDDKSPASGYRVDFLLDGKIVGTGITNKNGIAKFNIPANKITDGSHKITIIVNGETINNVNSSIVFTRTIQDNETNKTNKTSNNPAATAAMKETGIPIITVLLVLISLIGVSLRRKQN